MRRDIWNDAEVATVLTLLQRLAREETLIEGLSRRGDPAIGVICMAEALHQFRAAARNAGRSELRTVQAMPRSTHRTVRSQHRRLFERGYLLPQGHLPANLEVLLVPGIGALVNVHLRLGHHSVPVGGLVTNPKRLARMVERLDPSAVTGWAEAWRASVQNDVAGASFPRRT